MKQLLIGIFQTLFGLLAPIYMLFLVWFIKWDKTATYVNGTTSNPPADDPSLIKRGDLPKFLRWAQTMDMRYPAGMYEPAMREAYGNGSYARALWTSYLWTGHRNRAQGLAYMLGKPADKYIPDPFDTNPNNDRTGWIQTGNTWHFTRESDGMVRTYKKVGPIYLVWGYEVYRLSDGTFWAVNQFTIKK